MQGRFPPELPPAPPSITDAFAPPPMGHHIRPHGTQKKNKWTPEEDDRLASIVAQYGTKNWTTISYYMPNRNSKQCRERYTTQLDPSLNKQIWSPEEDLTLLQLQSKYKHSWAKIASFLNGRSSTAVKNRWNYLQRRQVPDRFNGMMTNQPPQSVQFSPAGGSFHNSFNDQISYSDPNAEAFNCFFDLAESTIDWEHNDPLMDEETFFF